MELTTAQAANQIGIHPITARRLCAEHGIGRLVSPRLRLLDKKAVAKLKKTVKPKGFQPKSS